jgi:urease accessory protein
MSSSAAQAHLSVEGVSDLANGALHPLTSPSHVLMFLSLALFLGQRVPLNLKMPMLIFSSAFAGALLFTLTKWAGEVNPSLRIAISLVTAILVVLEMKIPPWAVGMLCGAVAVGIGLDSAPGVAAWGPALKVLAGNWLSVNAVVFYIALCASNGADQKWSKTAIRVIGSWMIAICLMALAFAFQK